MLYTGGGLQEGCGGDREGVKIWLKIKTMQDFHGYMSNITTLVVTRCFPGTQNDFSHVRKEREVEHDYLSHYRRDLVG